MAITPITSFRFDDETKFRLEMLAKMEDKSMTDVVKSLINAATAHMVAIMDVDTMPVRDMMQNIGGVPTQTVFELDPQERRCWVTQEMRTNSTSMAVWHNRNLSCNVYGHPDESDITAYLSGDGQALMQVICDGHTVEWDGSNMVGRMTDAALTAWDELQSDLDNMTDKYSLIDVHDWMSDFDDDVAGMTDEELAALAQTIIDDAMADSVSLDGDVLDYLTELRDEEH